MEQYIAYGLMAVVVAMIYLVNARGTRPVLEACDRFGLLFLRARDYAVGGPSALPLIRTEGEGVLHLYPPEEQPAPIHAMLARGAGAEMAGYDAALEQALRDLFLALGKSQHMKTRYFDYLNTFFTLHKLFLELCAHPGAALTQEDWVDLERYMSNRDALIEILSRRLSAKGRRALTGQGADQPQSHGKEGIDETV